MLGLFAMALAAASSGAITPPPKGEEIGEEAAKSPCPSQKYERLLLADEQKMVDVKKPHHHDVLCGRG